MTAKKRPSPNPSVLSARLSKLARLTREDHAALQLAGSDGRWLRARTELIREGEPIRERRGLLSGWALRQRIMMDGQRQILHFLVPGDLIGNCAHSAPLAATTTLAVTEVMTGPVPTASSGTALADAYSRSAAMEEHYLVAQVTRIGRLDAYHRIVDWLLETHGRLAAVGLANGDEFALPLNQEMVADTLGLTAVHTNRMLQSLRRDGLLESHAGMIKLLDRRRLEELVDFKPTRVSSS